MLPPPSDPRPCLVFGCGYLGQRVARAWLDQGRAVVALTRNRGAELQAVGIRPHLGDVLNAASLANLPAASTVLYAVGFDRRAGRSMREVYVDGLRNVLAALPQPGRFITISSTGVYGGADGEWVDEDTPPDPRDDSGRVVRAAELSLPASATVLRFAGIYGPGRVLGRAALEAGDPIAGDPDRYLNLIHVADGVRAVRAAEAAPPGGTFNVCDDDPPTRRAYYTEAARVLRMRPPTFEQEASQGGPNRRVRNARAKQALGFAPAFPNCREGLAACV